MPSSTSSEAGASFVSAPTRRERLRQLRPSDLSLGAQTLVLYPALGFALRRWGLRRVQERLKGLTPEQPRRRAGTADDARRLAWIVEVTGRRGPWQPNCLQRSVMLWWLLARRGYGGELCIGVRRKSGSPTGSGTLDFHAWVELEGAVLNDTPRVREAFATFGRPIASPDARWR